VSVFGITAGFATVAMLVAGTSAFTVPRSSDLPKPTVGHDFAVAAQHLKQTTVTLKPGQYPIRSDRTGRWETSDATGWTSGFLAGSLWQMYEQTGDPRWRARAEKWQAGLESEKYDTTTHDVGFILLDSFGNGYRLTHNDAYRRILLTAASSLAKRFNPTVGSIRSWGAIGDPVYTVIIDNMMNLELLFWAAKHGGSQGWYKMAVSHALNTIRDHVRPDGSTYHVVNYAQATGAVTFRGTDQGYSDSSTWSRGQAWAVYGFTMAYRETGDVRFLDTARRTADYFVSHLPSDHIPYWDFALPSLVGQPRDTSAAAIAAAGLLQLDQLDRKAHGDGKYRRSATAILKALSSPAYLNSATAKGAILLHGTQNKPNDNFDTGLIFGDYFFLEALNRLLSSSP
jgi:unsaturated chondroitin disaccharide hydrolase